MSGPGPGGSNPRKFSEKIALHNQKQAEETQAFEQLMTDLTMSRVQFQKVQQLRLSQSRGQYYGGSLPNVNQICNTAAENQAAFPQALDPRGTRHHGLVERVHRPRVNSPHTHRRSADKHRHCDNSSPYGQVYLSPPPDHTWRRDPGFSWMDDKRPGFRLMSQLNRTNSDSALHTSVMNPPDAFGPNQSRTQSRAPQRNTSLNEAEDGAADVFSFPSLSEDAMMGTRPLPKQLWDAKVQSLSSRPESCEVPGINIFPSPDQNVGVPQYQPCPNSSLGSGPGPGPRPGPGPGPGPGLGSGLGPGLGPGFGSGFVSGMNTGGSLPDLTNLQFPPPLSTPIDSDENYTNHLPHAMMQMGLSSSLSNPSLCSSPRRRPAPISPLTLSPEQQRGAPPLSQGVPLDPSLPREPPPPYPHYPQSHSAPGQQSPLNSPLQQGATLTSPSAQNPQNPQNLQNLQTRQHQNHSQGRSHLDYSPAQNMSQFGCDPFMEPQFGASKRFQEGFGFLDGVGGNCSFNPSSSSSLFYSPAPQLGLQGNSSSMQMSQGPASRPPMLFPQAALPNIILTDDSMGFSLEDELRFEPLTLDGLSMLSDPELVLPDPTVEESFRSDRL